MASLSVAAQPTPSHLLAGVLQGNASISRDTPKPAKSTSYQGYDHVHWYVGNAKQAAAFYVTRMGFKRVAYKGLETKSRVTTSHVVRNGSVTFVFTTPLLSANTNNPNITKEDKELLHEIHTHLEAHGDAVKDVAFRVDDVEAVFKAAVSAGAVVVSPPKTTSDEHGSVTCAQITTYGDTGM